MSGFGATVRSHHAEFPPGAIFCLRERAQREDGGSNNPLYPYYLVYVGADDSIIAGPRQPKRTLDALRSLCLGETELDRARSQVQGEEVRSEEETTRLQGLLRVAVAKIRGVVERSAVDSLAEPGGDGGVRS